MAIFGVMSVRAKGDPAAIRRASPALSPPDGGPRRGTWAGLAASGPECGAFELDGARIVFRGEIYDRDELRRQLARRGRRPTTDLASELVLHSWLEWGEGCQERFNGGWSFAVWDESRRRLFCSRDRFGLVPFYHRLSKDCLIFGSDIGEVASCPLGSKEPDPGAVFDYLAFALIGRSDGTFYKGVRELPAGHCLRASPGRPAKVRRYYDPYCNLEVGRFEPATARRHAARLRSLLEDSVRARLAPPYPLGSLLSGGLDSSSIACLAPRVSPPGVSPGGAGRGRVSLFSILWEHETPFIDLVAGASRLQHRRISAAAAARLSWGEVRDAVRRCATGPLRSSTFFGELTILKEASRRGVRVLLDGSGSDELLAGYPDRYYRAFLKQVLLSRDSARFMKEWKTFCSDAVTESGHRRDLARADSAALNAFLRALTEAQKVLADLRCLPK